MRAKINHNQPGDEDFLNRLLSCLKKQETAPIVKLQKIRPRVLYVKTSEREYILKGYSTDVKLKLLTAFTDRLKKEGFQETCSYLLDDSKEPLFLDGHYYGRMEYIEPHHHPFTYYEETDRVSGLKILKRFHRITQRVKSDFYTSIQPDYLVDKWEERLDRFIANKSDVKQFLGHAMVEECIEWAKVGLQGMNSFRGALQVEKSAILHGDVAHHNFIRAKTGKIYLIDFDLIGIGAPAVDYLQYANRILPFIGWSLQHLSMYKQVSRYMNDKSFLFGLIYPTDILREWNRTLKGPVLDWKLQQVINQTVHQYQARRNFVRDVMGKLGV
ncbi:hypothetical protein A8F94_05095 [Bacillus sp. FJAT-27225]|uniref:phosphotransferase n=1 Tax=Bacillus sp. FJAT-27225 TaxID=1743144 RepID=UPI00080C3205|nr:phosphotransferase [Bacillus sp. FJAT-27225]OCA91238.1 hypothetical protein A8F94_05095 [Bacillus sp. FJAT-27225]